MKIEYFAETDSLYIELKDTAESVGSKEIANGFVVDLDQNGHVIGIDIDSLASQKVDLSQLDCIGLNQSPEKTVAA